MKISPVMLILLALVGYLLLTRQPSTSGSLASSNSTGSKTGTAGNSLDNLISGFTGLLSGLGKAVAGSSSSDASNATETI